MKTKIQFLYDHFSKANPLLSDLSRETNANIFVMVCMVNGIDPDIAHVWINQYLFRNVCVN